MQQVQAPTRLRPELDLGPMSGDPEYLRRRIDALVRTFAALLDAKIELADSPEGGKTDCYTTIYLPFMDPEVYLVAEHELSHWLFGSDPALNKAFSKLMVSKLLNRAGIKPGTPTAMPYESHLTLIMHMMSNILDDHRCAGLWGCLYPGGEELLRERWEGIVEYEIPNDAAKENLLTYFAKVAQGIDVPDAPQMYQLCKGPMQRALNLVEGVDAAACLGITARMIEEILDEILMANPPPPPPQAGGGGQGQQQQQQGGKKKRKTKSTSRRSRPMGKKQRKKKEEETKHAVAQLLGLVPRKGKFSSGDKQKGGNATGQNGMGSNSPQLPQDPRAQKKLERMASTRKHELKRVMKADETGSDESGLTPLQLLMTTGAQAMAARIEDAERAMLRNQDDGQQATSQIMLGWSQVSGIQKVDVTPTLPLPPPSEAGYAAKRALEQFRMQKRTKKSREGDFHAGLFMNALGAGELDREFFTTRVKVPLFELLFLFDFSGSMFSGQALHLVERALADATFAVTAIKSKSEMWGYSNGLYAFTELGSVFKVPGLRSGSTMTVQALDVAKLWAKMAPTKRAILHMTDGWPTSCRAQRSSGDPLKDLRSVVDEILQEGIPISTLTIRHPSQSVDHATKMYNKAFGAGRYGMVSSMDEVHDGLVSAVEALAKNHLNKSALHT